MNHAVAILVHHNRLIFHPVTHIHYRTHWFFIQNIPHTSSDLVCFIRYWNSLGLPCLPCSITQAVEVDVHIRATRLPLQTEDIVGVCHQHWTVKPSRTKRLVTPNNERAHSPECHDHGTRERCESTEVTPLTSLSYICRPNHRQPPHTGQLVYYCFTCAWETPCYQWGWLIWEGLWSKLGTLLYGVG